MWLEALMKGIVFVNSWQSKRKEWYELEDLMAHQSRLLQEGGYLDSSSDESEASYSSGSESNSSD